MTVLLSHRQTVQRVLLAGILLLFLVGIADAADRRVALVIGNSA